jgi:HD-GYP domain-containing protein (c-di-GMP phosphodiesterase class II)
VKPLHRRRLRILHVLLVILIAVSVFPVWFFGTQMIAMNRERLETQERLLQITISQSLSQQISLYVENMQQQVKELFDGARPVALGTPDAKFATSADLQATLEGLMSDRTGIVYVTVLNREARGRGVQTSQAGGVSVATDAFVRRSLEAAFLAAEQGQLYESNPITLVGPKSNQPVMVMAQPLMKKNAFAGMMAAVATLEPVVKQLNSTERLGLEAYIVDGSGRIVASNNPNKNVAGVDMIRVPIVQEFIAWHGKARLTETSNFNLLTDKRLVPMVGTYSPTYNGRWGVIVQAKQSDAFASVNTMRRTTVELAAVLILLSLVVAFFSAKSITRPIDKLTESARAIARRDFSVRADVRNRTEIGELAEGFNTMAEDLQKYVADLKAASEENRQLFIDSIEMIAAAVDAKDPYTKGHSGRVAQYSVILSKELGLEESEVEKIRVSATLHDVGKIGVDDRVLKKPGVLTNEEFELMKRHTVMGFEIVRQVKQLGEMLPGIRWHHEALNGQGYPDGVKGDEIPLMVRIIAVADTFDAITTDRPYQAGRDFPSALAILRKHAGSKYDPITVDALCAAYEKGALRKHEVRRSSLIAVPEAKT